MPWSSNRQWEIWLCTTSEAQPQYHQSNVLADNYIQFVRSFLSKGGERGNNPHFALMLYRNTLLGNGFWSQMELLYARQARSDLPMSHAAKMQLGQVVSTQPKVRAVRPTNNYQEQVTTNLLPIGTDVMYKTPQTSCDIQKLSQAYFEIVGHTSSQHQMEPHINVPDST